MIRLEKDGAELSNALAEIKRLRESEAVKTAAEMARVSSILDVELRELRKQEREGSRLIQDGITLAKLHEILKAFDGDYHDD
jgi:ribosome-binding ATPase YchF (GTP1/OBG family)